MFKLIIEKNNDKYALTLFELHNLLFLNYIYVTLSSFQDHSTKIILKDHIATFDHSFFGLLSIIPTPVIHILRIHNAQVSCMKVMLCHGGGGNALIF